ncbi:MAG: DUF4214 domain-containing protein [Massilia sp.]
MTTPSTNIYVRPGWNSYTWTYGGTTSASGAAIAAVAFDLSSADGQQVARGDFQYSVDNGRSWTTYTLPFDQQGAFVPTAGAVWRFADHAAADNTSLGSFTMRWKLADGTVASTPAAVVVDLEPVGIVDDHDTIFTTMQAGAAVATLSPIDTGAPSGGRWVIDSQSQPGLFAITPASSADGTATLTIADSAAMPASGLAASVTVHYYDRYQLDTGGNPIAGAGVSQILTYTAVDGAVQDLAGFGADLTLGASTGAYQASPAMATLSGGGFVTVWQGPDQGGAGVWAQLRDAGGTALGAPFAVAAAAGATEGQPAVAALAGGRFVVAYSIGEGGANRIAYRIVEANGAAGTELIADAGAAGDAAMPAVATLADGSFVIGWRSGGAVHTLQASAATGAPLGAEHVSAALGSAFSPGLAALHGGGYVLAWGEIADGNVYASIANGAPVQVSTDGAAASISTAAPLPHVAALAGGGFVVAWDSYSNDTRGFTISDIFVQRYDDAGNKLGDLIQADVDSGTGRFDAAVAALSDGGFVVAWQSQMGDFDGNGVYGRRFGADGSAIDLHEFEVNQLRQGDQASPALTALAGGGFVAAWVDTQGGASSVEARVLPGIAAAPTVTASQAGQGATAAAAAPASSGTTTVSAASAPAASAAPAPAVTAPQAAVPAKVLGGAGDNAFVLGGGSHVVDGQGGIDTVLLQATRASVALAHGANGVTLTDSAGVTNTLLNVERIKFSDASVALDIDGVAGQAYRLYQAAFDRKPDLAGLGFWIDAMDHGATLEQVAAQFEGSKEFAGMYGAQATNAQFVGLLYQNVLHRPAEGAGYDYWMDALANHNLPRAQMLGYFSESNENQAQVIGSIQDGITFTPWG